jgi:hypothetical protein
LSGQSFVVLGQYEHYGAPHVLVRGADGATHLFPAWMATEQAGASDIVAIPRLPVERLVELREFLDRLAIELPSEGRVPGGHQNDGKANKTAGFVRHACVFRGKAASDSDPFRPLIPTQAGH